MQTRETQLSARIEVLEKRLARYEKRRPDFTGTRFHHFDDVATVAVRTIGSGQATVGVSLLALPQYRNLRGRLIDYEDLPRAADEGEIESVRAGDQFNRALGRMISHGRAKACRGLSGLFAEDHVHATLLYLRAQEQILDPVRTYAQELDHDFIANLIDRAELQMQIVTNLTTGEV